MFKTDFFLKQWLTDPFMKTYDRVDCFAPSRAGNLVPPRVFNTWPGFRAEKLPPIPDNEVEQLVAPILNHLRSVICNSDDLQHFHLACMAQHVQDPATKSGVGLILMGEQGVGKDIISSWYVHDILGPDIAVASANMKHVFGDHSLLLQNKILCLIDEADPATVSKYLPSLKSAMTDKSSSFNPKGKNGFITSNLCSFWFITNMLSFPFDISDRRFVALDCNNSKKNDTEYFDNLAVSLNDRSARALFQYLQNYDISAHNNVSAKRPDTDIYRRLQQESIPLFYQFMSSQCLRNVDMEPISNITASDMFQRLKLWANVNNFPMINPQTRIFYTSTSLGMDFTRLMAQAGSSVARTRTSRSLGYSLVWAELMTCLESRKLFDTEAV